MKIIAAVLAVGFAGTTFAGPALPSREISFVNEVSTAQQRGLAWLLTQQAPDGSWRHHPAITALAALVASRQAPQR